MTSIQLQIIKAAGQLRRETFSHGPVGFGRDSDNQIRYEESFLSRKHGVLHQQDDQWLIENLSDNGTWINGKRIKRKAVPVSAGDVISVGGQEIMRVEAILQSQKTTTVPLETASKPVAPTASAASRKAKLWISIALSWVVILALLVFVQPLFKDKGDVGTSSNVPELSHEQIVQYIRRPPADIATGVQTNERQVTEYLKQGRDISARLDASADAPYRAYRAYQRAMAYSGRNSLDDSRDMREYTEIESQLITGVTSRYSDAYAKKRTQNFREAESAFRNLTNYFPEHDNPLIRNVEAHRREMAPKLRRRR